jgi:Spy/CpxP family protein refolding chaperone
MKQATHFFRPLVIAGALALALPFATQANAQTGDMQQGHAAQMHHRGGAHHGDKGVFRDLNLSEAQKDKIFDLRHAASPDLRDKGKQARAARKALRELAHADNFDESKARALSEQTAGADAGFMLARLRLDNQIYQVLTPEQRKQLEARKAQRKASHNAPGHRGGAAHQAR